MNTFRRAGSALSWVRDLFTPWTRCQPIVRRKRRCLLGMEVLEDRTVLDMQGLDVGPVHLYGDFFLINGVYKASGDIEVGLKPPSGQDFQPLAHIVTTPNTDGAVSFAVNEPIPTFTVSKAELVGSISGNQIPLWKTDDPFTFNAQSLGTNGVNISTGAEKFALEVGQFTFGNIRFAAPDTTAAHAQIKLQGSLTQEPLEELSFSVTGDNFVILDARNNITLTGVAPALSGSMKLGGLELSVDKLSPSYSDGVFVLTGATTFKVEDDFVTAEFLTPGLRIQNGTVTNFNMQLTSKLVFSDVTLTTKNLRVNYTQATSTYGITGAAEVEVDGETLKVTFGGGGTNGLLIKDGSLQSLDMLVQGSFHLVGLELQAGTKDNPLTITYSKATQTDPSQLTVSGTISVPELWDASVILGTQSQPGIVIKNGHFQLERFEIELEGVTLGAFTVEELLVVYTPTTFQATLDLYCPGGWKVGGTVGFLDGKLNTVGLSIEGNEGIEIPDTGIMITGFSGELQNLQHPADIIVSGSLTAVWITKDFIQVEGDFTVDKNELVLHGNIEFLQGLLGTGDVRLVLDWGADDYSATVKVKWTEDAVGFEAEFDARFDMHDGDDLYIKARADVKIPDKVPFIGGHTLADIDFVLEWHKDRPNKDSFVAAWVDIDLFVFSIDVGVKVDFSGGFSVIGSSFIHHIDSPPPDEKPLIYHYRIPYTVPQNATQGTLHVQWPEVAGNQSVAVILPDGTTTIDQGHFSDQNNLTLVPALTSHQSYGVGMVGSSRNAYVPLNPGAYQLVLTSSYKFKSAPTLTTAFGYAPPTVNVGTLSQPSGLEVPVNLSGNVVTSLGSQARATLYVDGDNTGYDGVPLPGATNLPVTFDANGNWSLQTTWDMDGLLPVPYYVYASINDGVNGTVHSAYSNGVTPNPPLGGVVSNPHNSDPLSGFTVYLDADSDGQYDPATEVAATTNAQGYYSFHKKDLPVSTPFYVGVVMQMGYQDHPDDTTNPNPRLVTYDGVNAKTVNFDVDEFAAIHGRVYADFAAGPQPLGGWNVYLDRNNNGRLDVGEVSLQTDDDGTFAFRDLPLRTTQFVRVLVLPQGYYLTSPGVQTVIVTEAEFEVYKDINFGVLPYSSVSGTVSGYAMNHGSLSPTATPEKGWTVQLQTPTVAIDAGGAAAGDYLADQGFSGDTQTASNDNVPVKTDGVTDPAPQAVYQSNRYGKSFAYTLTGLTPGQKYVVRLHFAELYWQAAGQRAFNVAINGQAVLTDYDLFARAGGAFMGIAESFTVAADGTGRITLQFTALKDNAQVNGIEVSELVATALTDASGNYSFDGLRAGTYRVAEVPPTGWRQVAPFQSDLQLQPAVAYEVKRYPQFPAPDPTSLGESDFDGDGRLDVAVLVPNQGVVNIYYGGMRDVPGAILGLDDLPPNKNTYHAMILGDFWGKGGQDVAVLYRTEHSDSAKVAVWPNLNSNSGPSNFGRAIPALWTLPDYRRGIVSDVVRVPAPKGSSGDQLAVFYYNHQGHATLATLYLDKTGAHATTVALPNAARPQQMLPADVNDDGFSDLVISDEFRAVYVVFGSSTGFGNVQTITGMPEAFNVLAADVNGDGLIDLGAFDKTGMFFYATQDQAGNFTVYPSGIGVQNKGVGGGMFQDVDGDLLPDLVWVVNGGGPNALHVVVNSGQTGAWFVPSRQTDWPLAGGAQDAYFVSSGDLDGNGLADLIFTDPTSGTYQIVYNRSVTNTVPIEVTLDGDVSTGNNLVNAQFGQVGGRVFEDVSRDGLHSPSEPGRAGVTVYVDRNRNERLDPGEPTSRTGPNGLYAFEGLLPGTYQVRVAPQHGQQLTTTEVHEVVVSRDRSPQPNLHFGVAAGFDLTLVIPADESDWTLARNGDRLEVNDATKGVVASYPLSELSSVTISGKGRVTLDLAAGGFIAIPDGILFQGTGPSDRLRLVLGAGQDRVTVEGAEAVLDAGLTVRWTGVERLTLDGGAGDDEIRIDGTPVPGGVVELIGGAGADLLVGGDGDDLLSGGTGRDILIGGRGADQLLGQGEDDLLVGGTTTFDDNEEFLEAVAAEWHSVRSYKERVENLIDGTGTTDRVNGDAFLNIATVLDDLATDTLFGGPGEDWFLAFAGDAAPDRKGDEWVGWSGEKPCVPSGPVVVQVVFPPAVTVWVQSECQPPARKRTRRHSRPKHHRRKSAPKRVRQSNTGVVR